LVASAPLGRQVLLQERQPARGVITSMLLLVSRCRELLRDPAQDGGSFLFGEARKPPPQEKRVFVVERRVVEELTIGQALAYKRFDGGGPDPKQVQGDSAEHRAPVAVELGDNLLDAVRLSRDDSLRSVPHRDNQPLLQINGRSILRVILDRRTPD